MNGFVQRGMDRKSIQQVAFPLDIGTQFPSARRVSLFDEAGAFGEASVALPDAASMFDESLPFSRMYLFAPAIVKPS